MCVCVCVCVCESVRVQHVMLSFHFAVVTVRAPENGDQLCGHDFAL